MTDQEDNSEGEVVVSLEDFVRIAKEDLAQWHEDNSDAREIDRGTLSSIAASCTPIYNWDILDIARSNLSEIATREVESPAFDGSMTAANVAAMAIYDYLYDVLADEEENYEKEKDETL